MTKINLLLITVVFIFSCTSKQKNYEEELANLHTDREWGKIIDFAQNNLLNTKGELFILADAYFQNDDHESSIPICNRILKIDSTHYYTMLLLANNYLEQKKYSKAEKYYRRVIDLQPNYARAYLNLGYLYERRDNKELAINNYIIAIEIFASNDFWEEVLLYSNHIISIDSMNIEAHKFLAAAYRQKKDYDSAIHSLIKVLTLTYKGEGGKYTVEEMKSFIDTQVLIGNLFYHNREYEKALDILEPTIDVEYAKLPYTSKLLIYCNISACYNKLENMEKHLEYLNLAKEIDEERTMNYLNELLNE